MATISSAVLDSPRITWFRQDSGPSVGPSARTGPASLPSPNAARGDRQRLEHRLEHPLRSAGHVVRDHVIHRDAPAGDRHAGLARGDVDGTQAAVAGRAVELERHDLLTDHGV